MESNRDTVRLAADFDALTFRSRLAFVGSRTHARAHTPAAALISFGVRGKETESDHKLEEGGDGGIVPSDTLCLPCDNYENFEEAILLLQPLAQTNPHPTFSPSSPSSSFSVPALIVPPLASPVSLATASARWWTALWTCLLAGGAFEVQLNDRAVFKSACDLARGR